MSTSHPEGVNMHDIVHVHVDNAHEIAAPTSVETTLAEHVIFSTLTVGGTAAVPVAGVNPVEVLLDLDPLRQEAYVIAVDHPVVLCHTASQTSDPANFATGVPNPQGAYLPVGATLKVKGTSKVWVVSTGTGTTRVSLIVTRRDK